MCFLSTFFESDHLFTHTRFTRTHTHVCTREHTHTRTNTHTEGDFPSLIHFWEEDRKHTESERRIQVTGFLSCFLLASSSARHNAPSSVLLEVLPSSPLPIYIILLSFVQSIETRPHDPLVIGSICGVDCPWEDIYTYICINLYIYTHIYIYIYIHIHIYVYMYIHIQVDLCIYI